MEVVLKDFNFCTRYRLGFKVQVNKQINIVLLFISLLELPLHNARISLWRSKSTFIEVCKTTSRLHKGSCTDYSLKRLQLKQLMNSKTDAYSILLIDNLESKVSTSMQTAAKSLLLLLTQIC